MSTHTAFVGTFERDDGPPSWERQSGVLAVYEASPKPVWTTDVPSHAGVWWVRTPGHEGRVVEVYQRDGKWFYSWTDVEETAVPRDGLQWSSRAVIQPIEAPRV